ncbi:hypothetical protein [Vibrio phage BONAISHI]|nr:hypothetical protein [Vibrio phage BONAISHI]
MNNVQMNPNMPPQPQVRIVLRGAKFVEIPATQPLFHRPMQFNADPNTILQLQNVTHGGSLINPQALREIAKEVVRPSPVPEGKLMIANDWNISRFAVYLNFEIHAAGRVYHEIITGYTDHPETSMTGLIDPDSLIFINSHLRVNESMSIGNGAPNGVSNMAVMSDTNVITPVGIVDPSGNVMTGAHTQRPQDVLTGLQMGLRGPQHAGTWDPRGNLDREVTAGLGLPSSRNNHCSTNYLTRIMVGVRDARNSVGQFASGASDVATQQMIAGAAAVTAADCESDYISLSLFQMLKQNTSYGQTGAFMVKELFAALGNDNIDWNNVAAPMLLPKGPGQATVLMDNSNGWGDYSNETSAAHQLAHGIPALCGRSLLSSYAFTATGSFSHNIHTANYEHSTTIFPISPMFQENANMTVKNLLETIILPEIFYGICDNYVVSASYTMSGSINMDVQLDGGIKIPYAAPNYCDHMSAPTVAIDDQTVKNNGMMIGKIVDEVFQSSGANVLVN